MKKQPLVSLITVNFNGNQQTEELLHSLYACSYPNLEIFVVDNASNEPPHTLEEDFPQVHFIYSKENLGFAGGNNLAIQACSGEYIYLINNDTEVKPNFLDPVVDLFESNHRIGIVSSKLIFHNTDDLIQYAGNPGFQFPSGRAFSRGFKKKDSAKFSNEEETGIAHGAAMAIRREVLENCGLLNESYFLYYEEVDFCERVKRNEYKIWYCGKSTVYHKESMSVGKDSDMKVYFLNRNRLLFLRRNTFGKTKRLSILFFLFLAVPKKIFNLLSAGRFKAITMIIKGLFWNLRHSQFQPNPKLESA